MGVTTGPIGVGAGLRKRTGRRLRKRDPTARPAVGGGGNRGRTGGGSGNTVVVPRNAAAVQGG